MLAFNWLVEYSDILIRGVMLTLTLTGLAVLIAVPVATSFAWVMTWGPAWLRPLITGYVEVFRNTPYMIQLFFLFFALPQLGVRLDPFTAAVMSLALMVAAFGTKVIEAGLKATPKGQLEAGRSLGMSSFQLFWYVAFIPALRRVWPALSSLAVMSLLDSAVVSLIAVEELTWATNFIQSRNFRSFETYFFSSLAFLCMAVLLRRALLRLGDTLVSGRAQI